MPGAASTSRVTLDGPSARGVGGGGGGGGGGHDAADPLLRAPHARHPPLSYGETVQLITEFLEVVLHTVLCVRSLYPQEVFTRKKTYGTPVWQARHPGLCEYIANAAKEVKKQMLRVSARPSARAQELWLTKAAHSYRKLSTMPFCSSSAPARASRWSASSSASTTCSHPLRCATAAWTLPITSPCQRRSSSCAG